MTARAALAKMRAQRYGLVISDWNMEPMTGYDLLQRSARRSGSAQTPFIMVTAESKTENVIAAKKAGVNELHRQAVQRADAQDEDRSGVRREADPGGRTDASRRRAAVPHTLCRRNGG